MATENLAPNSGALIYLFLYFTRFVEKFTSAKIR
jgi:hypothetical protein